MADQDLTSSGTPEFAGVTIGSDPVVSRDSTDTLTNKTLTSPIINTPSSSGHVYGGTYTAVASDATNLDSTPANHTAQYMRVGDVVTVSGTMGIDVTVSGIGTNWDLSLPIASDFTLVDDCGGVAVQTDLAATVTDTFRISTNNTTNKARFEGYPVGVGANFCSYTYTYQIK